MVLSWTHVCGTKGPHNQEPGDHTPGIAGRARNKTLGQQQIRTGTSRLGRWEMYTLMRLEGAIAAPTGVIHATSAAWISPRRTK
jgi:hypothetical protein